MGRRPFAGRTGRNDLWKRAPVTWIIVMVNILWYLFVEIPDGFNNVGLIKSGAIYPALLTQHGEWYRLVTAMFVHMSMMHILLNMVSLASLYVVEWLVGSYRYLVLYAVAGLISSLALIWVGPQDAISGGASGAIFGVFASALVLSFRGVLTKAARNQLVLLLIVNLVYGFSSQDVANSAHIGGLLAGALCTEVMIRSKLHSPSWKVPAYLSGALLSVGLLWGLSLVLMGKSM